MDSRNAWLWKSQPSTASSAYARSPALTGSGVDKRTTERQPPSECLGSHCQTDSRESVHAASDPKQRVSGRCLDHLRTRKPVVERASSSEPCEPYHVKHDKKPHRDEQPDRPRGWIAGGCRKTGDVEERGVRHLPRSELGDGSDQSVSKTQPLSVQTHYRESDPLLAPGPRGRRRFAE